MSVNVSGFGLQIQVVASNTFPQGVNLSQFSDDGDPVEIATLQIAEAAMGLNGDLIIWNKPNPIEITVHVLPRTKDDINMQTLLEANRVGAHKSGARDTIGITLVYPDGFTKNYANGVMMEGEPGSPVQASGRMKTKAYKFKFENTTSSGQGAGT